VIVTLSQQKVGLVHRYHLSNKNDVICMQSFKKKLHTFARSRVMISYFISSDIPGDLLLDIGRFIGRYFKYRPFLLQTIWRMIFSYRIGNRQKRRYRTISRPIFKTGIM